MWRERRRRWRSDVDQDVIDVGVVEGILTCGGRKD